MRHIRILMVAAILDRCISVMGCLHIVLPVPGRGVRGPWRHRVISTMCPSMHVISLRVTTTMLLSLISGASSV